MNFSKSFLALGIALTLFLSCKDAASKPTMENKKLKTEGTVVVINPKTASFEIEGMTCAMGCAKTIETKLAKMDGVQKASVDFEKKQATVNFDASVLTSKKLKQIIESVGDGETYKVLGMKVTEKG